MELQLRDYQISAIDMLREGFRAGHRSQILYLATGGGKTECAIALLDAARKKGTRAAMLLDRIVLCDQTSKRLDKYSIDHGVLQSGHWRYRPSEYIQVCSAQTIEKRGSFPGLELLIIDEVHQQRKQTIEFIKNNPGLKVIGLTATPFTKGLGSVYSNVVSPITTKSLVENNSLVPLRVFIAKEIDMEGAKKVAGEWSQAESTSRGMKITGDIVAEWIKKTHEVFGKPEKTIVFCSGVDHGKDLQEKFAEQGYNFISISYKDDDQFKKDVIDDFNKPDTDIHGLIATDILTKGFDAPSVKIGVSARPFSKSLSSHIQQMGRIMRTYPGKEFGLWLCLAKGSKVLTDKGLVAIDKVKKDHKIWDGTNFVSHGGAVCNGIQEVITYQGLTATAGHLVHTAEGWRTFGHCAAKQIRVTQTGFGGQAIRLRKNLRPASFLVGGAAKEIYSCAVRMCDLWVQKLNIFFKSFDWSDKRLQGLQSAGSFVPNVAIQQGASNEGSLLRRFTRSLPRLRSAWCGVQIFWGERRDSLDNAELGSSGVFFCRRAFAHTDRQNKPIRSLRAWEFALAFCRAKSTKQARESGCSESAQIQDKPSRNSLCRQYFEAFILGWTNGRTDNSQIPSAISKTEREVWDILDAGPHNRFTCEGLLVHNCHSGNYLRFRGEWDDVFENGVSELDDGAEKAKKEPTEKEKKESKCPSCSAIWPVGADVCSHCGHVRERMNKVSAVPGEMHELKSGLKSTDDKQAWWSMCQYKVRSEGWSSGRAAHTYKEKFGVWPRGLDDSVKFPSPQFDKAVRASLIKYLRGKR